MSKFDPPGPNPSNADLADSLAQVHECVEEGKRLNETANLVFSSQVTAVSGQVSDLRTAYNHTAEQVTGILTVVQEVQKAFWRGVGAIVVAIIVGCIGLGFQAIENHNSTLHSMNMEAKK